MSERVFVYPEHPNFQPFLDLAETTELTIIKGGYLAYRHADVPYALTSSAAIDSKLGGTPLAVQIRYSKQAKITEDFWGMNGGLDTLSFYKNWPDNYVNDGYRVQRAMHWGDTPLANELITYGVGVLRPRKPERKGMWGFLAQPACRVDSLQRQTLGTYIVDYVGGNGSKSHALESTNLVMPETLGELRQLQARRGETDLLQAYLTDMQDTVRPRKVYSNDGPANPLPAPESIGRRKWRWREAHRAHINSGLWSDPPADINELMDRIEELLARVIIDSKPVELIHVEEPSPELLALIEKHSDLDLT